MRGLNRSEVADRVARGLTNATRQTTSRPLWFIIRDNVFTLFNAILTVCFLAILLFGDLRDGLFYGIVVANSLIGIVQELRAKIENRRIDERFLHVHEGDIEAVLEEEEFEYESEDAAASDSD